MSAPARPPAGSAELNNAPPAARFSIATPFGGWQGSGIGREKGRLRILEYMEQESRDRGINVAPLPWAA